MAGVLAFGNANSTIEAGANPLRINTSTTTVVKSAPGILVSVVVNTKGTVASTITIYDNTAASGTIVSVIDSLNNVGTFTFNCLMSTGITVVTTGAPDITVIYR